jgi:FixJ family two-component response regulator
MKAGALDFLEKPVDSSVLVAAVCEAKEVDASRRQMLAGKKYFEERMSSLTRRERQVLDHVFLGRLNKQIAGDLGTAEKTIKVHRRRMMKKMGVKTVADLVSLVQRYDPRPLP